MQKKEELSSYLDNLAMAAAAVGAGVGYTYISTLSPRLAITVVERTCSTLHTATHN